tara:strand:+ start:772 stop:1221 length:450 start_codon:yes stop_codon:yes gene_type:complete
MIDKINFRKWSKSKSDIDFIIPMLVKHYQECIEDFDEKPDFRESNTMAFMNNDNLKIMIIEVNENIVGFLVYFQYKHPVYNRIEIIIRDVYIEKPFRRFGITSDCIKYFSNIYKDNNIFVDLLFDDSRADKFWRKNKFNPYQQRYKLEA